MAAHNSKLIPLDMPSNIEIERKAFVTIYTGTLEEIIAEGAATREMFPVLPKRATDGHIDGHSWDIKRIKGGRFKLVRRHDRVALPKPPAPWDPSHFRERLSRLQSSYAGLIELQIEGDDKTHRLHEQDVDAIKKFHQQIQVIIARARVVKAGRLQVVGQQIAKE